MSSVCRRNLSTIHWYPINIWLVDNKGGVKISDFGISKKIEEGKQRIYI